MRLWILILGVLPGCGGFRQEAVETVAFLVYDAGETLALLPVAERLASGGVPVEWIPLTPWAADLLAENGQPFVPLPPGIQTMPHIEGREGVPETGYWEEHLARAPPGLAVLGMVSAIQGRLAARIQAMGIPTRGYVDGFQIPGPDAISVRLARGWPGVDAPGPFDEVWVATPRVREGYRALGIPTRVAGQPTLESWRRGSEEVDPAAVRRTQGLAPGDRVLLWAGQYGEGYAETLDAFLVALAPVLDADTSLVLVLSHHPRTRGEVEREALARIRVDSGRGIDTAQTSPDSTDRPPGAPRAVMMSEDLTTMEMATASEVVLTWTSTVATQAAFMGRQAVYFSPPEGFDTHLVEEGAASLADSRSLQPILRNALDHSRPPESIRQTLLEAGYVMDADGKMAEMMVQAALPTPEPPGSESRGR